ncbi:MAG: nucleoside triphosphate pyrophosphohydrolase [Clostridia bacterium]|nr:nucleoside triphosphate pyrophosphohydrolase [Clostridia bacterium]
MNTSEEKDNLLQKKQFDYQDIVTIMRILRAPDGCPWDREQTHASIRTNVVEEAYELVDAINRNNYTDMAEEIGDLLLQCVLHNTIAEQEGSFTAQQVYNTLCNKLISRHSHVFGADKANDATSALTTWEANKIKQHKFTSTTEYMKSVPYTMPALIRATKVQHRGAKVGFDWKDKSGAVCKVNEEWQEVEQAIESGSKAQIEEEMGDLLFALVNVFRFLHVDAEVALTKATNKYINRFEYIEQQLAKQDRKPQDSNLAEMDKLWDESKIHVK